MNDRYVGHLVDENLFTRALDALGERWAPGKETGSRHPNVTHAERIFILNGMATCPLCGSNLVGTSGTNRHGVLYHYLQCSGRRRFGKAHCTFRQLPAEPWERAVLQVVTTAVRNEERLVGHLAELEQRQLNDVAPLTAERQAALLARDGIAAERERMLDLAAATSDQLVRRGMAGRISEIQGRYEAAELRLAGLDGQIAGQSIAAMGAKAAAEAIARGLTNLAQAAP